jgi:hypothetical protein
MRVTNIQLQAGSEGWRLRADIAAAEWPRPFELWFEVAGPDASPPPDDAADPWLAALLLPAMRLGERLEIDGWISPELDDAVAHLQDVYATWMPSAVRVEVETTGRQPPKWDDAIGATGLFFSCGVDSWFSLLRSEARRLRGRSGVSHLIVVHGVDIDVGNWKADVAMAMTDHVERIARHFGLEAVAVSTNVRQLYSRTGLSWHWGQAGALAAIGLVLRRTCASLRIAAGGSNASMVVQAAIEAGGCHPLLLPLYSTVDCEFSVDGGEASRLHKVDAVSQSQLALDTLRVCWASHEPAYNCGRCAKCVRTMLELALAGSLERCPTLPGRLDPAAIAEVRVLFPHEVTVLRERHARLIAAGAAADVLAALETSIAEAQRHGADLARALDAVSSVIGSRERFVVVDEDEFRYELGRTHAHAIPFTERDGLFNGLPLDDAAAVAELERVQALGAAFLVVWKDSAWALDHYGEFGRRVRAGCRSVVTTPEVQIFDLSDAPGGSAR